MPLIPTTVCGSHGLPSWLHLVREAAVADRLGPIDLQEAYEDAVRLAIRDQVEAGVDVISDGEMRRVTFIRGFYDRLEGIRPLPIPRRLGAPNYDSHCPYEVVDRVAAPRGLGIVEEFRFARPHADRPMRVAVPGPLTLLIPLRRSGPYASEDSLIADLIALVKAEIKALEAAGCDFIQVDEPNYVIWSEFPTDKEIAVGVVDVKAFHVETPEEIAARVRLALQHIPAQRLWLVPDCGLWETPRGVGVAKLRSMVEAARLIRRELGVT